MIPRRSLGDHSWSCIKKHDKKRINDRALHEVFLIVDIKFHHFNSLVQNKQPLMLQFWGNVRIIPAYSGETPSSFS